MQKTLLCCVIAACLFCISGCRHEAYRSNPCGMKPLRSEDRMVICTVTAVNPQKQFEHATGYVVSINHDSHVAIGAISSRVKLDLTAYRSALATMAQTFRDLCKDDALLCGAGLGQFRRKLPRIKNSGTNCPSGLVEDCTLLLFINERSDTLLKDFSSDRSDNGSIKAALSEIEQALDRLCKKRGYCTPVRDTTSSRTGFFYPSILRRSFSTSSACFSGCTSG
jgi:hypothetical protein